MVRNTFDLREPDPTRRLWEPDPTRRLWEPDPIRGAGDDHRRREPSKRDEPIRGAGDDHRRREPPGRDEPKGGKKPRGKGGAGRGFGGPNSGDEVDDDKGRRPPKLGDEMPNPRDYPVKNDGKWWLMIFAQIRDNYSTKKQAISNINLWEQQDQTDFGFDVIKLGLDVIVRWQDNITITKSNHEGEVTTSSGGPYNNRWALPLRPYYVPSDWRITYAERFIETPELGSCYYTKGSFGTSPSFIWTKYPEAVLKHLHLWEVPESDRPVYLRKERSVFRWTLGYTYPITTDSYWYPVPPVNTYTHWESESNGWKNTGTASYSYKLYILSEDKDFYPQNDNVRNVTIPDMNEECCGMIRRIYEFLDPESFPAEMPEKNNG